MEMKTKKYLTAGTYPKTNGKIVEMEKKIDMKIKITTLSEYM